LKYILQKDGERPVIKIAYHLKFLTIRIYLFLVAGIKEAHIGIAAAGGIHLDGREREFPAQFSGQIAQLYQDEQGCRIMIFFQQPVNFQKDIKWLSTPYIE